MNKKLLYQVGNNKKLYYDAQPTKYQDDSFVRSIIHLPYPYSMESFIVFTF